MSPWLPRFRLYEAAEAGSIPIVEKRPGTTAHEDDKSSCASPWTPFVRSGAPFIWVDNLAEDIEQILRDLRAEGAVALAERQAQLRRWYFNYMTAGAMAVESVLRAHEAARDNGHTIPKKLAGS